MENNIKQIIESADNIALFGHKNPDWDSIWSVLWLSKILQKMGKKTSCFTPNKASKIYDFVDWIEDIAIDFDYANYDILIFLDFSSYDRIGTFYQTNPDYFHKQKILVFDHHLYSKQESNWTMIHDLHSMSACELVFEKTYQRWPELFDSKIATCFYLWLTTDSGNFRYDTDHQRVMWNALKLINLWADKKLVVDNTFRKKSFAGIKMMEKMFARLTQKWWFVYSRYTQQDLTQLWIDRDEADFGQVIIQDIDEAKVTAIFRTDEDDTKIPMSKKLLDILVVADTNMQLAFLWIVNENLFFK